VPASASASPSILPEKAHGCLSPAAIKPNWIRQSLRWAAMPQRSRAIRQISNDLDRIYATVKAQAGHIDVLAANAGVYEFASLGEITEEHFDRTFNTNVRGLLFAVQKALPLLTKGSSVILTGSMVSIKGFPSCSVYNASKAAIRSFARGWIVDLKRRDIRVNVLRPRLHGDPRPLSFHD
jgi:NAD(P)-dependent dehydrogenase (short-subunit alcohol dehydrogenase family)